MTAQIVQRFEQRSARADRDQQGVNPIDRQEDDNHA